MRHDETPLQFFTAQPGGIPVPVVRPHRRREDTIPFRSRALEPPAAPPPPAEPAEPTPIRREPLPAVRPQTARFGHAQLEARRALAEAPTWIFETHAVSAAAPILDVGAAAPSALDVPSAFDAPPTLWWRSLDAAYDRPLRRWWRALLRLLGIQRA